MTKICTKCKVEQPLKNYSKDARSKGGLQSGCKSCYKAWREANKEYMKAHNKAWHKANKEYMKAYKKAYREANKEYIKAHKKAWKKANKEHVKAYRKDYEKQRKHADPFYKFSHQTRKLITLSFKKGGWTKTSRTYTIIGLTFEAFYVYAKQTFEINYGRPLTETDDYHIDHIVPLSTAKTKKEVEKLNHYTNLQLLLAEDNLAKGACLDWESPYQKYLKEQRRA